VTFALCCALFNAGNSIAARMAMMAMTTSSLIKVKARRAGDARPVGLLRLFMFGNEMTGFKIYVHKQKAVIVSRNSPQLPSPKSWLPTTQRQPPTVMTCANAIILVEYIAYGSVFY
jgi:hypothetical protein